MFLCCGRDGSFRALRAWQGPRPAHVACPHLRGSPDPPGQDLSHVLEKVTLAPHSPSALEPHALELTQASAPRPSCLGPRRLPSSSVPVACGRHDPTSPTAPRGSSALQSSGGLGPALHAVRRAHGARPALWSSDARGCFSKQQGLLLVNHTHGEACTCENRLGGSVGSSRSGAPDTTFALRTHPTVRTGLWSSWK